MLAPCYKRLPTRDMFTGHRIREASNHDIWSGRAENTLKFFRKEIFEKKTAIIALQEYWLDTRYSALFQKEFVQNGYEVSLLQRTGPKVDAVAMMVRSDVFEVLSSENVYLCSIADRVALILWLRHKQTGKNILVVNTHLSFPHSEADRFNQLRQMESLTAFIDSYAEKQHITAATRIVLGDFNVEASSPVCDHLRAAGYYSCFEVCPPVNAAAPGEHNAGSPRSASKSKATESSRVQQHQQHSSQRPAAAYTASSSSSSSSSSSGFGISSPTSAAHTAVTSCSVTSHPPSPRKSGGFRLNSGLEFVSHHTHKEEDLGVDHIFVRPECRPRGDTAAIGVASSQQETVVRSPINNSNSSNSSSATMVSSSPVAVSAGLAEGVFVDHTAVLPRSLSAGHWQRDFAISDHRPVTATILFAVSRNTTVAGEVEQVQEVTAAVSESPSSSQSERHSGAEKRR